MITTLKKSMDLFRGVGLLTFLLLLVSCGGGGAESNESLGTQTAVEISVVGLKLDSFGYEIQNVNVSSNLTNCTYSIVQNDVDPNLSFLHVKTENNRDFSFRNPIVYGEEQNVTFTVQTVPSSDCQSGSKEYEIRLERYPTLFEAIPTNWSELSTSYFQANDIGLGGIVVTDRFTSTICYPTANDCSSHTNELFGQDAHNMTVGDFNGDGYEDFVVAWALFPHTIEPSQKINAPINSAR